MIELHPEQIQFLREHNIQPSAVFDATGLSRSDWREGMKLEGKLLATGVPGCKRGHRSLRSHSGHCVQCAPKTLSYVRKYYERGYVYISGSAKLGLLKVGCSQDPDERHRTLNAVAYGGAWDWTELARTDCNRIGEIEFRLSWRLGVFSTMRTYTQEGRPKIARELYTCSYDTARDALLDILGPSGRLIETQLRVGS